jgi:hypothetical protein
MKNISSTMGRLGATVAGTDPSSTGGHPKLQTEKRRLQMNKFRFTMMAFAIMAFTLMISSSAQAQATRTWVSGVGDDANPCSRTAPCKTFAGAISKTATAGEIDCLDPGGFGAVTITKSITIDGTTGAGFGGILAAGTNGIIINPGDTGIVSIRNLSIDGAATGLDGIRVLTGRITHIEGCVIFGFRGNGASSDGIDISLTTAVAGNQDVKITNTTVRDNSGNGIRASNSSAGNVLVVLDNVRGDGNANGYAAGTNSITQISNSHFTFNTTAGINVTAGTTQVDVDTCFLESNNNGLLAAASVTRIANCRISGNGTGISFTGGTVQSFGDNKVKGNFTADQAGGSVTSVPPPVKI